MSYASSVVIADHAAGDQTVPDEQHDQRADRRGDEACTLLRTIVTDGLANPGRQERAHDPEHGRQDEAARIVRPRRKKPRENARDKADDDNPDDAADHFALL